MSFESQHEYARANRRRRRQALGLAVCLLVILGLVTLIRMLVGVIGSLFDQSELKANYQSRLQCFVMLDPLPFDSVDQLDASQVKEYAVWSTIYNAMANGSLDQYQRDPDTDGVILPAIEVNAAVTGLFGPNYAISENATFESSDMVFLYLEDQKGYLVPVTGAVGQYSPTVEEIHKNSGYTYVTVGYIPTFTSNTYDFVLSTEPVKYMDYVFEKVNKTWYLKALQESEKAAPGAADNAGLNYNDVDLDYDPTAMLQQAIENGEAANGVTIGSEGASSSGNGGNG